MSDEDATPRGRGGLWGHRDFRVFWIGETTSSLGTAVSGVALPLVAVETLHASAFVVTALTAAIWLPWLVLGLPAGGWVDRLRRRRVMMVSDAVSVAAFVSVPLARWLGVLSITQLLVVALFAGSASVFFRTAYQAYLPSIIEESDLTEGNAKLTGSASVAQVGGPGLGGAIAQLAGPATGLLADAVSFAVSFACLSSIRAQETPPTTQDAGGERRLVREVGEGLRFVLDDRLLRRLLLFGPMINFLLTAMNALDVVFLIRTVGIAPGLVGAVFAAGSAGGLLGAVLARPLARRWGSSRAALAAITVSLPFALLIPLTSSGAGLVLFAMGVFILEGGVVVSNILFGSFFQTYVPPEMLGRAGAGMSTAAYSMMPAGALVAGVLSTTFGTRAALWILTTGIAASGLVYLTSPLRRLRDFPRRGDGGPPARSARR